MHTHTHKSHTNLHISMKNTSFTFNNRAGILGQDGGIQTQNLENPLKKSQEHETPDLRNSQLSENFCFHETECAICKKSVDFPAMLDNFLVSW